MNTGAIIGYSGHSYVVLDMLINNQIPILGYCEIEEKSHNPYQLSYLGKESDGHVQKVLKSKSVYLGLGDNIIRAKTYNLLSKRFVSMPLLVDNNAHCSQRAVLGDASVVMPGVIINALARIGNAVICNSASVIEHECEISDFAHIAPGAVLAGNVKVGKGTFIGANTVIKEGIKIGQNVIVGAGSVVVKNLSDNSVFYGNPAKKYANG